MNGARYAYLRRICKLVEQGKDIIVVSEDYAAPMFDDFRIEYPNRFLSVGVAEQNGMAVACGLALAGKYPIVYGCAPFPLTRAIDQVKSAVAGMHLPMTILNSGIGFGVPEFGATHYNIDDISIVRGIPGVRIITPSDNVMAEQLADYSVENREPLYVRFDKNSEGELYKERKISFDHGFAVLNDPGSRASIAMISCGFMLQEMYDLAQNMADEGIYVKVIDLYSLPFNECELLDAIADLPVLTVEEHIAQGGIGSAVLETLNKYKQKKMITCMGVDFKNSYPSVSGSREYFIKVYGLTPDDVAKKVKEIAGIKK